LTPFHVLACLSGAFDAKFNAGFAPAVGHPP
jgi:hypothetical protein